MIVLSLDMRDIERVASDLRASRDQIPYAMSRALNDSLRIARNVIVKETWPQHVDVFAASFMNSHLRMVFSTKSALTAAIVETPSSVSMQRLAEGGTKQPTTAKELAIPPLGEDTRERTSHGRKITPRMVIQRTPKRALRITAKGIFVGSGGRLHLKYAFKPRANQPKHVPFYQDFQRVMSTSLNALLPGYLNLAMQTRR